MEAIGGVDSAEQARLLLPMLMVVRQNGGNSRVDMIATMRRVGLISARAGEILDLAGRTLVTIPNTNPHGKVLAGIVQKSVLQILDDSYRLGSSPTLYREEAREVLAFINRIIPDLSARRPLSPVVEKIPQGASPANDPELAISA